MGVWKWHVLWNTSHCSAFFTNVTSHQVSRSSRMESALGAYWSLYFWNGIKINCVLKCARGNCRVPWGSHSFTTQGRLMKPIMYQCFKHLYCNLKSVDCIHFTAQKRALSLQVQTRLSLIQIKWPWSQMQSGPGLSCCGWRNSVMFISAPQAVNRSRSHPRWLQT